MRNNVKSKNVISIVVITLLIIFTTTVHATNDSFHTTLKIDKSQAKREDTVTITIGLKDINIESGEKGIGAYTASVKFDPAIFEYVSTNGTDKWEAPFYQNGLIAGNTKDGEVVNTTQNIGTITFKVKKDAKLGETAIELTNFSGSTAVTDVATSNGSIKVTIVDNNSGNNNSGNNSGENNNNGNNNGGTIIVGGDNNNQNSGNNNGSNSNNNSNNIPSTSNGDDSMIKQGTLPKTGTADTIVFTIIGVCTILASIFFIKMVVLNRTIK